MQRDHSIPPDWVLDNFVKSPYGYYDSYRYYSHNSSSHSCRELTLCEVDAEYGWRVIVGECAGGYTAFVKNWRRCGIGVMHNLENIRGLFEFYKATADYVWAEADIESLWDERGRNDAA